MNTGASADVLTSDGLVARIRLMRPDDEPQVLALHERASESNIRLRFFSASRAAAQQYVAHVAAGLAETLALVAELGGDVVALATAEPTGTTGELEVAFFVDDTQHGRGLGSLLLEHLAALAVDRGVERFTADVLLDNVEMRRVFLDAGFALVQETSEGVTEMAMDLTSTTKVQEAIDTREAVSERRSLRPLLYPGSVAVLGVRRDGSGVGAAVLRSVVTGGYGGGVHVVHPSGGEVAGMQSVPSCGQIEEPVDLALVAVPAARAVDALRDVAAAGIRAAVVLSSGFREMGAEGARLQRELVEVARASSIRLVGPNCLGLMSNAPELRLNATFCSAVPEPGGLAIASQSGGVGIVLLDAARTIGLGVRLFVSLGNKADVSGNDLIQAWIDDPDVSAGALYLESFGNAVKFARLARRFSRRKPLLAVVGGRSEGGRRAGASHTAAAASDAVAVQALVAQTGVIRCSGADELAETALFLEQEPLPRGPRVGVVTNAGGIGVLASDVAEDARLVVPALSEDLGQRIARHLSGSVGASNPIDTGAGAPPEDFAAAAEDLMASAEVDIVLVVVVATSVVDINEVLDQVGEARRRHPEVPVALVPLGATDLRPEVLDGFTVFASYESALSAVGKVVRYAAWLEAPYDEPPTRDYRRSLEQRTAARALLTGGSTPAGWLGPRDIRELLLPYHLDVVGEVARGPEEVAAAAARTGFPVAVKVASPDVLHKTDRGLVAIGLTGEEQVRTRVRGFAAELGSDMDVLVQPMARGVEVAVGLVRDPVFGPLVMVAAGGVEVDVWNDRAFLMAPVSAGDAARAVRSLRIWPLLAGHRGAPPVDVAALEDLVVAVGRLGEEVPEVAEMDLNPVMVAPEGCTVVDVRVRLAEATERSQARALSAT